MNRKLLTSLSLLNEMGAKVKAGTETITVTGVEELHGATHNVVQDRIKQEPFMAAMTMACPRSRYPVWNIIAP